MWRYQVPIPFRHIVEGLHLHNIWRNLIGMEAWRRRINFPMKRGICLEKHIQKNGSIYSKNINYHCVIRVQETCPRPWPLELAIVDRVSSGMSMVPALVKHCMDGSIGSCTRWNLPLTRTTIHDIGWNMSIQHCHNKRNFRLNVHWNLVTWFTFLINGITQQLIWIHIRPLYLPLQPNTCKKSRIEIRRNYSYIILLGSFGTFFAVIVEQWWCTRGKRKAMDAEQAGSTTCDY